jgi:hypothetical protein
MKKESNEFIIIKDFKEFIILIESKYDNCPKKDIYLKEYIYELCYEILGDIYFCNISDDRVKQIDKIITKLKLLDFSIKRSMDKGMINHKSFLFVGNKLNEIVRMNYGWLKSEESKSKIQ